VAQRERFGESDRARDRCDLAHDAGQHPNAISQQGAVGRMVDVSTTVVSTRIRRPAVTPLSRAISTIRS
jgi:hypothetical protein